MHRGEHLSCRLVDAAFLGHIVDSFLSDNAMDSAFLVTYSGSQALLNCLGTELEQRRVPETLIVVSVTRGINRIIVIGLFVFIAI